ncbi:hypothetical protein [Zoogloea sp.]|uniref:SDH family Clp fold serine proteinase n=1 Tax=Zoogloea sp. TaxID=49181 RepID=UPI0035AE3102
MLPAIVFDMESMVSAVEEPLSELMRQFPLHDVIVMSRSIERALHADLSRALEEKRKHDRCIVFLTTYGGDPDAGYRIARCLRHHYKHVRLMIPSFCKSAGTLITICANEVVIGDRGELGPLDVQVMKSSELAERSSGLDIIQALQAGLDHVQQAFRQSLMDIRSGGRLSTKLAGEFASKIAVGVAAPLYAQIDPNRLGEMQRAMRIAHEYGQRLDKYSHNLKPGALDRLVAEYPSHSFVIDRKEATELFVRVLHPTQAEVDFCRTIWTVVETESGLGPLIFTDDPSSKGELDGTESEEGLGEGGETATSADGHTDAPA